MVEKILKSHLHPEDDYIYGFADLTGILDKKFKGFDFGISIGKRLDDRIVDQIINGPTQEYYALYSSVNKELAHLTEKISKDLNSNNIETYNIKPTVSTNDLDTIYFKTLRTDLSHKMVATRAGLGWIGKTDLLISKKFGPRLRLVSIILKTPVISKSKPIDKSRCGSCNICVDICPAKAANGKLWDISVEREIFFDPHKCRNKCIEFGRERLGSDIRICGICVSACPLGK
jgi:epoxyqueuosine reductase